MKLLGITGGIGSGKSTVARCFAALGAELIDADAISRQVLDKDGSAYLKVVAAFGTEFLRSDGQIDRKKLAATVFGNPEQLRRLNAITHPCIFEEMERRIQTSQSDLVCLDVPLLFSTDFPFHCDKTLAVLADEQVRIRRVMERDGLTDTQVKERMACQLSDAKLKALADFSIINEGGQETLAASVQEIYHKIMETAI